MKVYFQIGTNVANDSFFLNVRRNNPDLIILVEPFKCNFKSIHDCYKGYNYKLIEGIIHGEKHEEDVSIFLPANDVTRTMHATLTPDKVWGHEGVVGDQPGELQPITVKAFNFNTLCKELKIDEIECLCIDTEGYDNVIINSIDFEKIQINMIVTEKWGWCPSTDTNTEDAPLFGKPGEMFIAEKLSKQNYIREEHRTDYIYKLLKL
jgi:FkbM family methyltransferase